MARAQLQKELLQGGRENRCRASFGGNLHCRTNVTKAVLVYTIWKDQVGPGETAYMPYKGGGA